MVPAIMLRWYTMALSMVICKYVCVFVAFDHEKFGIKPTLLGGW